MIRPAHPGRPALLSLSLVALLWSGAGAQESGSVLDGLREDSQGIVDMDAPSVEREGSLGNTYDGTGARSGAVGRESGSGSVVDASSMGDPDTALRMRAVLLEAKRTPDMNWHSGLVIRPVPVPRVRNLRPERKNVPIRSGAQQGLEGAALIMTAFLLLPAASELSARAIGTMAGLASSEDRPALEGPEAYQNDERSLC
ncbi:MAG: hypothetical protein A2X36_12260 [Elusimicrobia bacterium GWA2_69_24]|nr:MAG: hypothetical protein A2X36_12260 [Elusimicrobia bacterium GWA2_69_24]HBL17758.1 hypothetical protein [Elusimicrobiota bacterium]